MIYLKKDIGEESIQSIFNDVVEAKKDKIAVKEGGRSLSYGELKEMSDALGHHLIEQGVMPKEIVILNLNRSIDYIIALLGVIKANATFLPLDPKTPTKRRQTIAEKSKAKWMIANGKGEEIGNQNKIDFKEIDLKKKNRYPSLPFQGKIPLYVTFTSGSTGTPKGVIGTELGLVNRVEWMEKTFPYFEDEVLCQKTSLSFVDHIAEIFQALLSGQTLVILKDEDVKDVQRLGQEIEKHQISRIVLVPSLLRMLIQINEEHIEKLSSLKFIFCSGETLPQNLAEMVTKKMPWIRLINIYGSSEVSADVAFFEYENHIQKRMERLFEPVKEKDSSPRADFVDMKGLFNSVRIPEQGMTPHEYNDFFQNQVVSNSIDVSDPLYIGHMTSGIPTYFHELSKEITKLNQNLVKIESSNFFTYLEKQTIGQFHQLVYRYKEGYYKQKLFEPNNCLGVVLNGGTLGNIQALHIARQNALIKLGADPKKIQKEGFNKFLKQYGYQNAVFIGSKQMHYSIKKACLTFGMGVEQILFIDTEENGRIRLDKLKEAVIECKENNWLILGIIGIAGTTESGAVDPLLEMGALCAKNAIHFHVDAAWGGACLFSDDLRKKFTGIEMADSVSICGHKQLYLPMGVSMLVFRNPSVASKMAVNAAYQAREGSHDLGQFSLLGSKPAFSTYFHAGLMVFGQSGYRYLVEQGYQKAQYLAALIQKSEAFELIADPDLNIINYRYIPHKLREKSQFSPEDNEIITEANRRIQQQQFRMNKTFVSYTELTTQDPDQKKGVFRAVILNPLTKYEDFSTVLNDQLQIAQRLLGEPLQEEVVNIHLHQEVVTVPIGRPIDNAFLFILDENGIEAKLGQPGEIFVGGNVLSDGYLNEEDLTQASFITNPLDHSMKIFRTGDFGRRLKSGAIEFLGRKDQQVKIRGVRIEMGEIEAKIRQMEEIDEAAIVPKQMGEDLQLAVFYKSKEASSSIPSKVFRERLAEELPEYMLPAKWVNLEQFPYLQSGKIDRCALENWEDSTEADPIELEGNELKVKIINIVRKIDPNIKITDDRNFFEMGFNSLSLNEVLLQLHQNVSSKITLIDLYTYSTLDRLTKFLEKYHFDEILEKEVQEKVPRRREAILNQRKKVGV